MKNTFSALSSTLLPAVSPAATLVVALAVALCGTALLSGCNSTPEGDATSSAAPANTSAAVAAALQGTWKIASVSADADFPTEAQIAKMETETLLFSGDKVLHPGAETAVSYTLFPKEVPPRISLSHEGKTVRALYLLDKDTLYLCYAKAGAPFPATLRTDKAAGTIFAVLKRKKN
ncbi:MAG: hypothetical protein LBT53_03445 [Puniceicoccales bacterium]|jgi:uncharacterized protein (TIGR03067 family)|nr:hypothetical protein [Puniceicoccales bacterium]